MRCKLSENLRIFSSRVALVALAFLCSPSAFGTTAKTSTGDGVFESLKPLVFTLKTAISSDSPKASYGTAFVVDKKKGWLATNYHVVSSAVIEPKKYKIYLEEKKKVFPAKILSVDVVHDLALIQVKDKAFSGQVKFSKKYPSQGEEVFSVGQPEDLNMSIVRGTFNGEIKYGAYSVVHMSSPINSGMSGGPTVNNKAHLVGINVSRLIGSQNISFSVPARYLQKLIEHVEESSAKISIATIMKRIEEQLMNLQDSLATEFEKQNEKTYKVGSWVVNQPPESLKCWSDRDEEKKVGYETFRQVCFLNHSAYLGEGLNTGSYEVSYTTISSDKINGFRFFRILNNLYNSGSFEFFFFSNSDKFTKYSCFQRKIVNKNNIPFQLNVCVRGYHDFEELLNVEVKAVSIDNPSKAIVLKAEFRGFVKSNIKTMIKQLIDQVDRGADGSD